MLSPIGLLVGLVLLVYGRRLYWLFVAGIGFLTGLALAPRLLVGQPEWMILLVALILALIGALLAVVAQKFVVGLIGFLAGGGSGVLLLRALHMESNTLAWIVYLLLGIAGLVLGLVLFEWALILLSSLAGANLIVVGVESFVDLSRGSVVLLVCIVDLVGILVQARVVGGPSRRTHTTR